MPQVPATVADFADLVDESIQKIFVKKSEVKPNIEKYFNVTDTNSYYEKESSVLGPAKAKFIGDNASVTYDAPLQGYDKTYTQVKYGDGIKISDHLWKFGIQFRKITNLVETLNDSMREKVETDGADMLNNSYTTSYQDDDGQTVNTAGGDGVAYFSASHTREDGGTAWNNVVTDGVTVNMDWIKMPVCA